MLAEALPGRVMHVVADSPWRHLEKSASFVWLGGRRSITAKAEVSTNQTPLQGILGTDQSLGVTGDEMVQPDDAAQYDT